MKSNQIKSNRIKLQTGCCAGRRARRGPSAPCASRPALPRETQMSISGRIPGVFTSSGRFVVQILERHPLFLGRAGTTAQRSISALCVDASPAKGSVLLRFVLRIDHFRGTPQESYQKLTFGKGRRGPSVPCESTPALRERASFFKKKVFLRETECLSNMCTMNRPL